MRVIDLKNKIIETLQNIDDELILNKTLAYLNNNSDYQLTEKQIQILEQRRTDYLNSPEKSFKWEDIKKELSGKYGL